MDAAIFGLIVADIIGRPMHGGDAPAPGGLRVIDSITLTTGGNVCNTGMAMARLGMSVAAAGLVGDDVLGRALVERLKSEGLDTSAVLVSNKAQTSATIVAVDSAGERCFYHVPGVTMLLDAAAFRRCFDIFRQCAWVEVGYFGLLPALTPELPQLLRELRQHSPGTKIALDTVNPPGTWQQLEPILPHLDVFAPSRSEAAALTGHKKTARIVAALRRHMTRGLIGLKLDAHGCYLDDGREAVRVRAYKVKVLDTTGAGDTWFGGLLTALRHDMPLEQAGRFANRVAADCCTAIGASAGIQSFEQTMARL